MQKTGANQKHIKAANQALIIREIRKHSNLSRCDLAKKLKLSNPSISKNIGDLIHNGIIREVGTVKSASGRRPIILEFVNDCAYIVAIDLSGFSVKVALANLDPEVTILEMRKVKNAVRITQNLLQKVMEEVQDLLSGRGIREEQLLAICIGTPGIVNPDSGYFAYAPRIDDYQNVNLKKMFESQFKTSIIVKNDVKLALIGESLYGVGVNKDNLYYLFIDIGMGSAIISDGRLLEGRFGSSGEIGTQLVDLTAFISAAAGEERNTGKIDDKASLFAIAEGLNHIAEAGKGTAFLQKYFQEKGRVDVDAVVEGVNAGDEMCRKEVAYAAQCCGGLVYNIIQLLGVDMVIIGGMIQEVGNFFIEQLKSTLYPLLKYKTEVVYSKLGSKAVVYGAIGEAMSKYLDNLIKEEPVMGEESPMLTEF